MLKKSAVKTCTDRLDKIANDVQENWRSLGLTKKAAFQFCYKVDKISDHLERMAGIRQSDVLQKEDDEPYMDNYDLSGDEAPGGQRDPDEPYMDHFLDDTGDEFGGPMEGETSEELQGTKDAFEDNWYDGSDKEASNWYEDGNDWY